MAKFKRIGRNALFTLSAVVLLCACSQEDAEQETHVALGDSITYGANLEDSGQSAYPHLIGEDAVHHHHDKQHYGNTQVGDERDVEHVGDAKLSGSDKGSVKY